MLRVAITWLLCSPFILIGALALTLYFGAEYVITFIDDRIMAQEKHNHETR